VVFQNRGDLRRHRRPIVATLIGERIVGTRFKIAPLLAKVFTPLFLVMALAYLVAMAIQQKSPFTDRDFLIAFNGLLLVVLALCVFSISERGTTARFAVADFLNIGWFWSRSSSISSHWRRFFFV
jgi:hypothetical protein